MLVFAFLMASVVLLPIRVRADTNYTNVKGQLIITSPNSNTTYAGTMALNFTVNLSQNAPIPWMTAAISYSIDDERSSTIFTSDGTINFQYSWEIVPICASTIVNISNLTNGKHELTISASGICNVDDDGIFPWNVSLAPVYFSVYNFSPPNVLILSPQNESYEVANISLSSIPLDFTIDKTTSWIGYSLDNKSNVTIVGNTTLTGLSESQHSLTIFANDTIGNMGASQPMNFTITVSNVLKALPFPTLPIATVSSAVAVAVGAGLLVYFKIRKPTTHKIITKR